MTARDIKGGLADLGYAAGWRLARLLPEKAARALSDAAADRAAKRGGGGVRQLRSNLRRVVPQAGEAELDELENMLKPLVSTWEGQAQEAYRAAQEEWDKAAQNMIEIAAKMGMAVNAANESYQAGEAKNAGRFGG